MKTLSINEAERTEYGLKFIVADAGAVVGYTNMYGDFEVTITQEGKDCDCGKGVFCPYNPQVKVAERAWTSDHWM